jgi:hypothetical protein
MALSKIDAPISGGEIIMTLPWMDRPKFHLLLDGHHIKLTGQREEVLPGIAPTQPRMRDRRPNKKNLFVS